MRSRGPPSATCAGCRTLGPFLASQPRVEYATFHLYPLANCVAHPSGAQAPTIAHIISPAASTGAIAPLAAAVRTAHAHHAALRLDELNSVACSGAAGVSDRLASALWALDTLFALAREGVDGVNIHTFAQAAYRTFRFSRTRRGWTGSVAPLYYGLLAFARATPPGARLVQTSQPTDPDLRIWATTAPDATRGHLHVVLINDSATARHTVAIKLPPGATSTPLTLERLAGAGGLNAASGISLGGQSFGAATATGQLAGSAARDPAAPDPPRDLRADAAPGQRHPALTLSRSGAARRWSRHGHRGRALARRRACSPRAPRRAARESACQARRAAAS